MPKHKTKRHPKMKVLPAAPSAAMPGPHEFSADEEQAMRAGRRQMREPAAPPMAPDEDMDGM